MLLLYIIIDSIHWIYCENLVILNSIDYSSDCKKKKCGGRQTQSFLKADRKSPKGLGPTSSWTAHLLCIKIAWWSVASPSVRLLHQTVWPLPSHLQTAAPKEAAVLFAQRDAPLCFRRGANRPWREQFIITSHAAAVCCLSRWGGGDTCAPLELQSDSVDTFATVSTEFSQTECEKSIALYRSKY